MAKLPSKNAFASETADSFGGIDRTDSLGKLSDTYDMANLRILPDGSLIRREGYTAVLNVQAPIRAAIDYPPDPDYVFVLSGEVLFSVNITTGATLEIAQGFNLYAPAFFVHLAGHTYLFCEGIYCLLPNNVLVVEGYIPLVGRNWGADGGEIYEPRNILGFQIRIDYLLDRDTNVLFTGFDVSAVDAVYVNGKAVTGAYIERQNVCLPAVFPAGTRVLLCLSLGMSVFDDVLAMISCTAGYNCGHDQDNVTFLYGGEDPSRLFLLRHATEQQVLESRVYYPDSSYLYCPADPIIVNGLVGGIRAICGEPDCLIVSGQYETRRLTPNGDTPIPGIEGCLSPASMTYYNQTAYLATPRGIRRLPLRSGDGDIISTPLGDLLDSNVAQKALLYYNVYRDELLVKDTTDTVNSLYIYEPARRQWIRFININAEGFFNNAPGRSVGFWETYQLLKFENDQKVDASTVNSSSAIPVYFKSRWTHLGQPDATKRLRRARLTYTGKGTVTATVSDKNGDICQHTFSPISRHSASFCDDAIRSGRTDQMQVMLYSNDSNSLRIHDFSLSAIK